MSLTQLSPPLPMETSKGSGLAHFVIDYGPESELLWVVFMAADGACWTVPNPEVRMTVNWTMGRRKPEDTNKSDDQAAAAARPPARFKPSLAHNAEG
jgi:hypothetical protein